MTEQGKGNRNSGCSAFEIRVTIDNAAAAGEPGAEEVRLNGILEFIATGFLRHMGRER